MIFNSLICSNLILIYSHHDASECDIGSICCHEETKEIQGSVRIEFKKDHISAPFGNFSMQYIIAHKKYLGIDLKDEIVVERRNNLRIVLSKKKASKKFKQNSDGKVQTTLNSFVQLK